MFQELCRWKRFLNTLSNVKSIMLSLSSSGDIAFLRNTATVTLPWSSLSLKRWLGSGRNFNSMNTMKANKLRYKREMKTLATLSCPTTSPGNTRTSFQKAATGTSIPSNKLEWWTHIQMKRSWKRLSSPFLQAMTILFTSIKTIIRAIAHT